MAKIVLHRGTFDPDFPRFVPQLDEAEAGQFKIERGLPMPDMRGRPSIYPFGQMEIGDSFSAPNSVNIRRAASAYGKRHGMRFTCRCCSYGAKTMRVWRVA